MQTKVYFNNNRGQKLCGSIYLPQADAKIPLVILLHGFTSSKECKTNLVLFEELNRLGIGTFAFDLMGHGESDGELKDITVSKCVEDLECAFEYLSTYKNIDFDNIALFGRSFGGKVVLQYISKHKNIKYVVLNSPCIEIEKTPIFYLNEPQLEEWKHNGYIKGLFGNEEFIMKYDFCEDIISHNIYEMMKEIEVSCLIVHGDADNVVPIEQSIKLKEVLGDSAKLEIIHGANHRYELPEQFEKVIELTVDFLSQKLLRK